MEQINCTFWLQKVPKTVLSFGERTKETIWDDKSPSGFGEPLRGQKRTPFGRPAILIIVMDCWQAFLNYSSQRLVKTLGDLSPKPKLVAWLRQKIIAGG